MKITEQQIQELYTFTAKHYVEFYDVQTELVDHLANGIEAQWEENPEVKFEDALRIEFKKFGIYGFSDVVEQKYNALSKHYRKQVYKYTKQYFKLPKIILTLFSFWALFKLLTVVENKNYIVIPLFVFLFVYQMWYLIFERKKRKKIKQLTGKDWLFQRITFELGGLVHCINFMLYVPDLLNFNNPWSLRYQIIFSIGTVLYILILYVGVNIVTPKLRVQAQKQFPQFKFI
ncbi:hypothetical protein LG651_03620 [Tamlana sp. 62-3]|uniref:Uncharacterized protein n=1 Tax=Neotamlana sargassicola TaxID=2883125 RepID=A0A9X1I4U9_9FLAO|nr:hypothetical protein [Tamlana sargassicola]MCB4807327.1 hypothetical protein [Tamlana sargassicola]